MKRVLSLFLIMSSVVGYAQIHEPIDLPFQVGGHLKDLSSKFYWLSRNTALRSGYTDGDSKIIGFLSAALGDRPITKGSNTRASASVTKAKGKNAPVFGLETVAQSLGSTSNATHNFYFGDRETWTAIEPSCVAGGGTSDYTLENIFTI
ncbi:MAG: hypothetical protein KDC53_02155 [Saprospiraceae bacterium]|nr:hypothetical protein [Saprospiraceae bacterium]